ncbi:claudin-22-like [Megalops cyprinoides]|uniref:claudin-22-like n=1 Tax=Megalops cyprinoides TaxID=118141 RepID=UPI0018650CE8|nr:claudin-22-like [Megalops cyprinoides]
MYQGGYVLELLGVFLYATAWLCTLSAIIMSQWLTLSTALLPTESYELGLWETCVVQELGGGTQCRPYTSLLGLPPDIRLARTLMCSAAACGLLGLLLAVPGLHVVNSCRGAGALRAKRAAKLLGGALCLAAGALALAPVSYMAHLTVLRFFDESVPDVVPRWEFGHALFCGWTAGFLHLAGGTLLLSSCFCWQGHAHPPRPSTHEGEAAGPNAVKSEYV